MQTLQKMTAGWPDRIHPNAKLSASDAESIRCAWAEDRVPMEDLAKKYDISTSSIAKIIRGQTYRAAPGPISPEGRAKRKTPLILSEAARTEIADRYKDGGITQADLADEYGVRQATISKIISSQSKGL